MEQCTAMSKQSRQRCRKPPMKGRTTCVMHGGRTTTLGPANHNFKHGRYSKLLPARMAQTYEEARTDPHLLSVSELVATSWARIGDLLSRVDSGEARAHWEALYAALEAFDAAAAVGNTASMTRAMAELRQVVARGREDAAAWAELQAAYETHCRLVLTETKTLQTMQQMVTTQQLMTFFGVIYQEILEALRAHADEASRKAIMGRLAVKFQAISQAEAKR